MSLPLVFTKVETRKRRYNGVLGNFILDWTNEVEVEDRSECIYRTCLNIASGVCLCRALSIPGGVLPD
jgi:hypothetical protein